MAGIAGVRLEIGAGRFEERLTYVTVADLEKIPGGQPPIDSIEVGTRQLCPGQRVEVSVGTVIRRGIIVISPDQIELAEVEAPGELVHLLPSIDPILPSRRVTTVKPDGVRSEEQPIWDGAAVGPLPAEGLPYLGQRLDTESGPGEVIKLDVPAGKATIQLDSGGLLTLDYGSDADL